MTDRSDAPELVSVAAVAANGVIGDDGELPWPSIPADKQQYRERIAEWPVVLGRATFESMLEDLPGSAQVVLSRSDREYVIGGGIYELFQPHVDRMVLSRLPEAYEGDTVFSEWDESEWTRVDQSEYDRFTLEQLERTETQ